MTDRPPSGQKVLTYRAAERRGTRLTSALVVGLLWAFVFGFLALLAGLYGFPIRLPWP